MSLGRIIVSLFKGKALALIGASVVLAGGATAVMAATPTGQHLIQTVITTQRTSPNANGHTDDSSHGKASLNTNGHKDDQDDSSHGKATPAATGHNISCPGLTDAQRLAGTSSLNTASESDDVQAICTLHTGTFKGTTPSGKSVLSTGVLGYGEIDQLLTYAQDLASHDQANTAGKLTSSNARAYLAAALQSCGTTPLATCVKEHVPSSQPDNTGKSTKENTPGGTSQTNGNSTSGDNHSSDTKNAGGRPTSTPTPHP
jgi:hypothetical protein